MKFRLRLFALLFVVGAVPFAQAQPIELNDVDIRASGEAYQKALRLRRIDNEVIYFDPNRPRPPLETGQSVRRERATPDASLNPSLIWKGGEAFLWLVAILILIGIVYLFVVFGGRLPVSFRRDPEDAAGSVQNRSNLANTGRAAPIGIEVILRMADRKQALVLLCKGLLARAVAAEGILLQDSWTDRDTLRHVPADLPQRGALQSLVFASERVQFGGRDVTEGEFSEHVSRLQPLWTPRPT